MDLVMTGLVFEACLVYLDDIVIFSDTLEEHLSRLEAVLQRLVATGLKLKPSKCRFLQTRVSFLGHVVSGEGIATDPAKIEQVSRWPPPTNVKEIRGFLGLCGYYRRFISHYAEIASPLTSLLKKGVRFTWTSECQGAFEALRAALTTPPVLAMPADEGLMVLDTDASDRSIGAVLSQVQGGEERVIAYASRVLRPAEVRYCVTRRELLAIIVFTKAFRQYILGRRFRLRTDHAALTWLQRTKEPIGQNARWLEQLGEYDFEIVHRPGTKHANADALSRHPCPVRTPCSACKPESYVERCNAVRGASEPILEESASRCDWWTLDELTAARKRIAR
jgi:hypothetical protein